MRQKIDVKDRTWAASITTQQAFEVEYTRRFPWADVIPLREEYLVSTADKMERINLPTPESFEPDGGKTGHISESDAAKRKIEAAAAGRFVCEHCPEDFPTEKGRDVHQGMAHKGAGKAA